MLGGSVDGGPSGVKPFKNLLTGTASSPHARNHQLPPEGHRFDLQFKQQTASQGDQPKKSPCHLLGHSFQISRQQQGQQRANQVTENTRYVAKRSDVTADHQN